MHFKRTYWQYIHILWCVTFLDIPWTVGDFHSWRLFVSVWPHSCASILGMQIFSCGRGGWGLYEGEGKHTAKHPPDPPPHPNRVNGVSQCCSLGCWPSLGGGGQRCVGVCLCVWRGGGGRMGRGVIIEHKPWHGDNTPHTQKTAHTQLETQVVLSAAWVPAQDTRM